MLRSWDCRDEIDSRFDRIVDFQACGTRSTAPWTPIPAACTFGFLSVAISVDPDVLIVDEALAVGDESFQRKCFARIEELRRKGTTILFVSHRLDGHPIPRPRSCWTWERSAVGEPKLIISNYQRLSHAAGPIRERIREEIRTRSSNPRPSRWLC